jgi:cytochrome c5
MKVGKWAAGLVLAALVAAASGASAPAQQPFTPADEAPEQYPDGPGRDDTFYACTACHGFKLIAQQGMNRRQWEDSIDLMVKKHGMPPLPEKEQQVVLDYLEKTYPPRAQNNRGGWKNPFAPN